MRYDGQYINVKRMGLALDGLIRTEYPGDFLQFIEMYTFAKPRHISEVAALMPKPVTLYDPVVRIKVDMSDPQYQRDDDSRRTSRTSSTACSWRGSSCRRRTRPIGRSCSSPTVCRRRTSRASGCICSIRPHPRTEAATLREGLLCAREGITINIFLLPSWNQTNEDVQFAYQLAEGSKGRVFFTAGRELDRYVVWDYIARRKQIIS